MERVNQAKMDLYKQSDIVVLIVLLLIHHCLP